MCYVNCVHSFIKYTVHYSNPRVFSNSLNIEAIIESYKSIIPYYTKQNLSLIPSKLMRLMQAPNWRRFEKRKLTFLLYIFYSYNISNMYMTNTSIGLFNQL